MRSLVFTIVFLGGSCLLLGFGLTDAARMSTERRKAALGPGIDSLDVTAGDLAPDLRAEESLRLAPDVTVRRLEAVYARRPREVLATLAELGGSAAVEGLARLHAGETDLELRKVALLALARRPELSARQHLERIARWPAGPDAELAHALLDRRRTSRSASAEDR